MHTLLILSFILQTHDVNLAKYDISGLYNKNNHWSVGNYTGGSLMMNICGQMDKKLFAVSNNDCSNTDAQICSINGAKYESKGSFYGDLIAETDSTLRISFTGDCFHC